MDQPLSDEAGGEVVEQLGMSGRGRHVAQIVGRGDEAFAEMLLPEAVDEDAGREGVFGIGDGLGEFEAAAAVVIFGAFFGIGRKDLEERRGTTSPLFCNSPRMSTG